MLSFRLSDIADGAPLDGIRDSLFDARGSRPPRRVLAHGATLVRGGAPARLEDAGWPPAHPQRIDRRAPEAAHRRRSAARAGRQLPGARGRGRAGFPPAVRAAPALLAAADPPLDGAERLRRAAANRRLAAGPP